MSNEINERDLSSPQRKVQSALYGAARGAYQPGDHVNCAGCGASTNTHDGYRVPTPLGDVYICTQCNRDDSKWDDPLEVFVGADADHPEWGDPS